MKTSITIILIFQLISCQSCKGQTTEKNSDAKKVVAEFYKWYIDDAYQTVFDYYQIPPFKKTNDSYIFDNAELEKRLNKIPYLSTSYKKQLLDKLQICNEKMINKKWKQEPEPQFNIPECGYLWSDNWVGGQGESINGFNIINEVSGNSSIEFNVEILINKKVFTRSKVTIEKEQGSYKIKNIELIWK